MVHGLTEEQMRTLRIVINRALQGPGWFSEHAGDGIGAAMHAELRNQTRTWLRLNIARELQGVLPSNERVNLDGVKQ